MIMAHHPDPPTPTPPPTISWPCPPDNPSHLCRTQIIDVEAALLQNVITFPPEGAFVVDSGIELAGERRVNFKFSAATLQLPAGRDVRLPPFGQGW